MAGLDTLGPLNRLVDVLEALPTIQQVYVGVPESVGPQVAAYIALGGQTMDAEAGQMVQRRASYFIGFTYAVAGAEADAETVLATTIDAFLVALLAERDTGMNAGSGPLVDNVFWDFGLATSPEYAPIAGQEFRVLPVTVTVAQHTTYG